MPPTAKRMSPFYGLINARTLPAALQALRENMEISTADMAALLHTPQSAVQKWESGSNRIPVDALLAFLHYCGCHLEIQADRGRPAPAGKGRLAAVGVALAQRRHELGLSQRKLGQQIGRSQSYVCAVEAGLWAMPPKVLHDWLAALGVQELTEILH